MSILQHAIKGSHVNNYSKSTSNVYIDFLYDKSISYIKPLWHVTYLLVFQGIFIFIYPHSKRNYFLTKNTKWHDHGHKIPSSYLV